MQLEEYQALAIKTAIYPRKSGLQYLTLGLAGEIGEIANKIKKVYRDHDGQIPDAMKADIAAEVGDALWYCAALATDARFVLQEGFALLPKSLPNLMTCGLRLAAIAGRLANYADPGAPIHEQDAVRRGVERACCYLNAVAYYLGFDLQDIAQGSIDKLLARKERGTLQGSGDKR